MCQVDRKGRWRVPRTGTVSSSWHGGDPLAWQLCSMLSPHVRHPVQPSDQHKTRLLRQAPRMCLAPTSACSPSDVTSCVTVIWLAVRVPVLSEQMTLQQPGRGEGTVTAISPTPS